MTEIIGLCCAPATETDVVLPGGPPPLDKENIALRESGIVILNPRIGVIVPPLLNLHNRVTTTLHLVHQIDAAASIVIGSIRNCLLLEWGHKPPERI